MRGSPMKSPPRNEVASRRHSNSHAPSARRKFAAQVAVAAAAACTLAIAACAASGSLALGSGGAELERDARGFVRMGTVRFHPTEKIVEADGYFNLRHGLLEFLACTPREKAHETLVALECDPIDLNAALLLLDLKKGRLPESDGDLRPIDGDRVVVFLRWQEKDAEGKSVERELRAEDCILNGLMADTMERCGFVYTGSFFQDVPRSELEANEAEPDAESAAERRGGIEPGARPSGKKPGELQPPRKDPGAAGDSAGKPAKEEMVSVFAAKIEGQLFALGHRPPALCNNPLELPYPDFDYVCYTDALPARRPDDPVPVTAIIRKPKEGEIDLSIRRVRWPEAPPGSGEDRERGTPAEDPPKKRGSGAADKDGSERDE
ncbi:MAG: YdjY domain-containing protein [Planctomycetes bacterium]|nr:YdjY domain-containing protein [Planctomycetota bacterium]